MSQDLTVQLSDKAYAAIRQQADDKGTSPAHVAAQMLEHRFGAEGETRNVAACATETARRAARERFERHFGAVDLGRATGADNASIDADLVRERSLREKLQKERPSLEHLIESGECDPDAVMTMGMYFDVQNALQALKCERERRGLSIGDVSKRSGLDRAVVSRLENGKQDNPTVATLMRYAAALGKRFLWSYEELASQGATRQKAAARREARKRGAALD